MEPMGNGINYQPQLLAFYAGFLVAINSRASQGVLQRWGGRGDRKSFARQAEQEETARRRAEEAQQRAKKRHLGPLETCGAVALMLNVRHIYLHLGSFAG